MEEFEQVFCKSPVKEHESGFGYNEGVMLYTLLKIINPELVIESGVMKGFTTYLIIQQQILTVKYLVMTLILIIKFITLKKLNILTQILLIIYLQ